MSIPKYNELYPNVLKVLSDGKEYSTRDMDEIISNQLNLSEEERNKMLPSGNQKLIKNRIGWARTYLKKAGFIESRKRGYVNITDLGLKVFKDNPNVVEDDLMQYSDFVDFVSGKSIKEPDDVARQPKIIKLDDATPDEIMEKTYKKINKDLADTILENISNNDPYFFEKLVVDLLLKMGYGEFREDAGFRTKSSNDEGIDGIINQDKLGLDKIGVQAKRYDSSQKIGRPLLQSFAGALLGKGLNKGVFITTSSFTNNAVDYVKNQSNLTITLIDGVQLANLMIEYNLGVFTIKNYPIKQLDSDYFSI